MEECAALVARRPDEESINEEGNEWGLTGVEIHWWSSHRGEGEDELTGMKEDRRAGFFDAAPSPRMTTGS
jgi:hypothetical protein